MVSKILEYVKHPTKVVVFLQNRCNFKVLPDALYLRICYKLIFHKKLDLDNPQTFNEKLQWLKLHDRKPEYTMLVDKYEVKKYVANIIGEAYIIPTLGVWDSFDEIDFDTLPNQFVLKCTHDSGGLVICRDKSKLDVAAARKKIKKSLKHNYYFFGREWPYKDVKPRIIAEPFIGKGDQLPEDYKIFTFGSAIDSIMVCKGRDQENGPFFYYYDTSWNRLYYQRPGLEKNDTIQKPKNLDQMLKIAEALGAGLKHVRVDLYNIDGKIYFGELTFFDECGFDTEITEKIDLMLGGKIRLE